MELEWVGPVLSCVGTVGQPRGVAVLIAFQRTLLNCDSERVPESNWLIIKHETVTEATLREAGETERTREGEEYSENSVK